MKEVKNHPSSLQSWFILSSGGLFFLLGFFHRVAPAVLHRELTLDFTLSASSLGTLTSLYYYSYTAMQILTGLWADLWGPRRLLAFGLISTAISSAFFAMSEELFWAGVARFLIGGSVAVAFVTTLKLSSHWLPPQSVCFCNWNASGCGNDRCGIRRIPSAPGNHPFRLEKPHSGIRTSGFADGSFGFLVCVR